MNVETRKTAAGTEYWDTKEKRVRFVPAGSEPDFEVTENPVSMLAMNELAGSMKQFGEIANEEDSQPFGVNDGERDYQLSVMTVKQLKALAEKNDIEIPKDVTKKEDIAQYIFDNWNADDTE
ncbi:hypothetical protein D1B31_16215 [Neobacillus notoginsengisoli]|uniref:Rho termination factor N-terminal domain-containing protein n=1 Tax=Neobacillus notoginsengisoli TaxID=1578198 RepID=A0A417YRK0_9BACI|nr:hypothetical protein [Neobacillus notoginsengisoli]RHW37310.1 hypothetical protein D1B31_16215 [Neobacillus notoginsengisoli]